MKKKELLSAINQFIVDYRNTEDSEDVDAWDNYQADNGDIEDVLGLAINLLEKAYEELRK